MSKESGNPSIGNGETLEAVIEKGLSARARFGHVALLLAAVGMSVVLAALLATEPALPARTGWAFAVLLGIGLCWTGYAVWVLKNRWTLLAGHRIVAGVMAVVFSAAFTAGAFAVGFATGMTAAFAAAATGVILLGVAIMLLAVAYRHRARLRARRRVLERALNGADA